MLMKFDQLITLQRGQVQEKNYICIYQGDRKVAQPKLKKN
jgi:hypothetical protein